MLLVAFLVGALAGARVQAWVQGTLPRGETPRAVGAFPGIVDRIESSRAILECADYYIELPVEIFPGHLREGDAVEISIRRNEAYSAKRRSLSERRLQSILAR
ncbi:MAG TPA: hypothetical protein GX506_12360 [Firmicutes bacterium]|nr:hypothetical protein [Bacillota bacterium]